MTRHFKVNDSPLLTYLNVGPVENTDRYAFELKNLPLLTEFAGPWPSSFTDTSKVDVTFNNIGVRTLNFPNLGSAKSLNFANNANLEAISAPKLSSTVNGAGGFKSVNLYVTNNPKLVALGFDALVIDGTGLQTFAVTNAPGLCCDDVTALQAVQTSGSYSGGCDESACEYCPDAWFSNPCRPCDCPGAYAECLSTARSVVPPALCVCSKGNFGLRCNVTMADVDVAIPDCGGASTRAAGAATLTDTSFYCSPWIGSLVPVSTPGVGPSAPSTVLGWFRLSTPEMPQAEPLFWLRAWTWRWIAPSGSATSHLSLVVRTTTRAVELLASVEGAQEFTVATTGPGAFRTQEWMHLAVSLVPGGPARLFVDGRLAATGGSPVPAFSHPPERDSTGVAPLLLVAHQWPGLVDDCAAVAARLDSDEVARRVMWMPTAGHAWGMPQSDVRLLSYTPFSGTVSMQGTPIDATQYTMTTMESVRGKIGRRAEGQQQQ
jgi:hypothetical protein